MIIRLSRDLPPTQILNNYLTVKTKLWGSLILCLRINTIYLYKISIYQTPHLTLLHCNSSSFSSLKIFSYLMRSISKAFYVWNNLLGSNCQLLQVYMLPKLFLNWWWGLLKCMANSNNLTLSCRPRVEVRICWIFA